MYLGAPNFAFPVLKHTGSIEAGVPDMIRTPSLSRFPVLKHTGSIEAGVVVFLEPYHPAGFRC